MLQHKWFLGGLTTTLFALAAMVSAAAAQSTNAHPIIIMNSAALDPSALPLVGNDARLAFADAVKKLNSGDLEAFVFVASPDGKTWSDRTVKQADGEVASVEDLARKALETCEYWNNAPCYILSVNGHDARDATGTWPVQPPMLTSGASPFDPARVPFVSAADRGAIQAYAASTDPRALVITGSGNWFWETGKTVFEAIANTAADCTKVNSPDDCILYAVKDRVVFEP
jgi:hypothetical protein